MNIRKANENDIPRIVELLHEKDLQIADGSYFDEGVSIYLGDLFLVAEKDNKIVGTVFGEFILDGAMLWEITVNQNYRKQGIGEQLLITFEKIVEENKKHFILLYSSTKKEVERFYRNRGYFGSMQFIEMKKVF